MTEELSSPAIDRTTTRVAKLDAVERIARLVFQGATFAMVVGLLLGFVFFVVPRLNDARSADTRQKATLGAVEKTLAAVEASQSSQTCATQVNAKLLATAFRALSAPPAPNTARDQTVADGLALANKILADPAHACDP